MTNPDSFNHIPTDETQKTSTCKNCGKPFTPHIRTRKYQKFGNTACQQAFWLRTYAEARKIVLADRTLDHQTPVN